MLIPLTPFNSLYDPLAGKIKGVKTIQKRSSALEVAWKREGYIFK